MRRQALQGAAARGHQPAGQAGRRSRGLHPAHRAGRRPRALRHVFLSVLCARDRRGQWLETACDQQREAREYSRRLRLSPDARLDGGLRGGCGNRRAQADMTFFRARHAMGRAVQGIALVAQDGFSARYDLDRIAGVFSRPTHKLAGQSYGGKVLVLDTAKGGVATAWMLHEMASRGVVPLALVFNSVNPILAQGAAFGDVPMLAGFDVDITRAIPNGASVAIDPAAQTIAVLEGKPAGGL